MHFFSFILSSFFLKKVKKKSDLIGCFTKRKRIVFAKTSITLEIM